MSDTPTFHERQLGKKMLEEQRAIMACIRGEVRLFGGEMRPAWLDRHDIPHWRQRLQDATELDEEERQEGNQAQAKHPRRHYDAAWQAIKGEYAQALGVYDAWLAIERELCAIPSWDQMAPEPSITTGERS